MPTDSVQVEPQTAASRGQGGGGMAPAAPGFR
eukprot:CAMPEP_0195141886 /NCGR_PEP_ID=MMETSP0448-20130528/163698_1 /TAXON_ID=66468 /ORGANISM="Heterocapsa triquestra, Strain CCMP 448" /LENGTH=31 /DNA_ID= /DNA_START= /DNA_END= /DNA_ORIENTATION=